MGKAELREAFSRRVRAMDPCDRERIDKSVCHQVAGLDCIMNARTVGVYSPLALEPDTSRLAYLLNGMGKNVAYPVITGERAMEYALLVPGTDQPWVGDPLASGRGCSWAGVTPQVVIVPGIAFDNDGYRLGHGGGFYDTWLRDHRHVEAIGVCYPCQLVDMLPREGHDIPMGQVVWGN